MTKTCRIGLHIPKLLFTKVFLSSIFTFYFLSEKVNLSVKEDNLIGEESKSAKLDCVAKGYPKPVVHWYKDLVPIVGLSYFILVSNIPYITLPFHFYQIIMQISCPTDTQTLKNVLALKTVFFFLH